MVRVNKMSNYKAQFRAFANKKIEALEKEEEHKIKKNAQKHLGKTLQHRFESEKQGFKGARVETKVDRKKLNPGGYRTKYNIYMADRDGSPHYIWHIINGGREKNKYFTNKRLVFRTLNAPRTQVGRLAVSGFAGYTGEWRSIPANSFLPSIKGRNWYRRYLNDYLNKHLKGKKVNALFTISDRKVVDG